MLPVRERPGTWPPIIGVWGWVTLLMDGALDDVEYRREAAVAVAEAAATNCWRG